LWANDMNDTLQKIATSMIPLVLAAMWWVIQSIGAVQQDIQALRGNMMMLIDPNGQIIPSPDNALARQQLRENLIEYIHDLQVRVKLLEEHQEK
jgi:hypothetical protein